MQSQGNLTVSLDGALPIKGLVGDVLKKPHRSSSASRATRMVTKDATDLPCTQQALAHGVGFGPSLREARWNTYNI